MNQKVKVHKKIVVVAVLDVVKVVRRIIVVGLVFNGNEKDLEVNTENIKDPEKEIVTVDKRIKLNEPL